MVAILDFLFELLVVLLFAWSLPGTLELLLLTVGAQFYRPKQNPLPIKTGNLVVIIPAHNEELSIRATLESLKKGTRTCDIVVVADNCTDSTASLAFEMDAKVLKRDHPTLKGKPHALHYAFECLSKENYTWYILIDGDTIAAPNFIEEVYKAFSYGDQAIQTRYEVFQPETNMRHRLMRIAFLAMNYLRPLGRSRFGLSCGIFGNGFGFTKELINSVPLPLDSIVEDLAFHLELVKSGYKVNFIPSTAVFGEIPITTKGILTQRIRWEAGRFQVLLRLLPSLVTDLMKGKFKLLEPAMELTLLPLAYHLLLILFLLFSSNTIIRCYAFFALGVMIYHLAVTISLGGQKYKDCQALLFIPYYVLWKIGVLFKTCVSISRGVPWTKSERASPKPNPEENDP